MNVLLITQARYGSTRLKGKVLLKLGTKTLLGLHLHRLKGCAKVDCIVVATTDEPESEHICSVAEEEGVNWFRGSLDNVLDRYYQAAKTFSPDWVVRVTSDCPLIDPKLADRVIAYAIEKDVDYCSNTLIESFPDGQDVEVFRFSALEKAWKDAVLASDKEHVTPYIKRNSTFNGNTLFTAIAYDEKLGLGGIRMTVDEDKDFEVVKLLTERLGVDAPMEAYVDLIQKDETIRNINSGIIRNEGYLKSLAKDESEQKLNQ